jgi:hypothetical protein
MSEILQSNLPDDMAEARALPGIQPLTHGAWLRVDDAYAAQMAHRRGLIAARRGEVFWQEETATEACAEVLAEALRILPELGFEINADCVICPDGHEVDLGADAPLVVLGLIVQEDICILQKRGAEHVLVAANLCFPAYWMLSEKAGRPLIGIHDTVPEYDADIARRVQRLFDGVRAGLPLWRHNLIWRDDPELFQPRSIHAPRHAAPAPEQARFKRAERQSIVRMPHTDTVVFSIHTYVVRSTQ